MRSRKQDGVLKERLRSSEDWEGRHASVRAALAAAEEQVQSLQEAAAFQAEASRAEVCSSHREGCSSQKFGEWGRRKETMSRTR